MLLEELIFDWVDSAVIYGLGDDGSRPAVGTLPCERLKKKNNNNTHTHTHIYIYIYIYIIKQAAVNAPDRKEEYCKQIYSRTVKGITVNHPVL